MDRQAEDVDRTRTWEAGSGRLKVKKRSGTTGHMKELQLFGDRSVHVFLPAV